MIKEEIYYAKLKWLLKYKAHWYSDTSLSQDGKVWESMGEGPDGEPIERELVNWRDAVDMESLPEGWDA